MTNHGGRPRDVLVRRYRRWRHGKLETVREALRSNHPRQAKLLDEQQLSLDL